MKNVELLIVGSLKECGADNPNETDCIGCNHFIRAEDGTTFCALREGRVTILRLLSEREALQRDLNQLAELLKRDYGVNPCWLCARHLKDSVIGAESDCERMHYDSAEDDVVGDCAFLWRGVFGGGKT